ncbi:MAG: S46 family peptidase [Ferruginibacter sp.]
MKKAIAVFIILISFCFKTYADEGMWLPQLLQTMNEKDMKKMGMKINASDIYSISKGSLKDAIVSFGGFCTAEIISEKGLLLTNHHCGFDAVQNHSSIEHNYIKDGFWAYSNDQELTNPGLFATFIIRIDDVSKEILNGVTNIISEKERQSLIDKNIAGLKASIKKESYQDILIRPFFEGNKYFAFITETYHDIRLVGIPPASIGNFGKDSDNWMWPRHTGDFSMFRIYMGKDGKPAEYATDNIPYKPKKSLSISLKGVKEGDFTMVFGFPGRTTEYLHSKAVEQIMNVLDPAKIGIREKALQVMDGFMRKDEKIKIQYAEKYALIENAYKKWQGEVLGLKSKNAVAKKQAIEAAFENIVMAKPELNLPYIDLVKKLGQSYADIEPYAYARDYYNEIVPKIELLTFANQLNGLITGNKTAADFTAAKTKLLASMEGLYGEYNSTLDQKLFEVLMEMYVKDQHENYTSPLFRKMLQQNENDFEKTAAAVYSKTKLVSFANVRSILAADSKEEITGILKDDIAFQLAIDMLKTYTNSVTGKLNDLQANINQLQRNYMQAQMEVFSGKQFYPDANSTLRVTYGKVNTYSPRDAVHYQLYTYLDGVMEKYKPADYEFDVPQKLIDLYKKKDFGPYGTNGKQTVCFIASNHTTGGNSGSPALDANGNLIGLNFDRVWEGTMSDINYDPEICRNIMVDIRYVLFIIDKFAGAKNLIAEMKIVR